jgi:cytidine deaminase
MKKTNSLINVARKARGRAKAPYSKFKVGAALESADGEVYSGCNIENASYGLTICAERVALVKALSEGAKKFVNIAIVTNAKKLTPPCGACRQLLWEYCGNIPVHMSNASARVETYRLGELLPLPFDRRSL